MKEIKALSIAVQIGLPVLLWSEPGEGKTKTVESIAKKLGYYCETKIASLHDPTDFNGLPFPSADRKYVNFIVPDFVYRINSYEKAVLFLDEINCAPPTVQAALLRIVLEKVVGNEKLNDSVRIIAACNPPELNSSSFELSLPLLNRFVHIDFKIDTEYWINGVLNGFDTPIVNVENNWVNCLQEARVLVASFIAKRRDLLTRIPNDGKEIVKAFPTKRTWLEFAVPSIAACKACRLESSDIETILLTGSVGNCAFEFIEWRKSLDLPDVKSVLDSVNNFKFEGLRRDIAIVLLNSAVLFTIENIQGYWLNCWKLLKKAYDDGYGDIAISSARLLAKHYVKELQLPIKEIAPFKKILDIAKV